MHYSSPGSQPSETLHFSDLKGKGRQQRWSWCKKRESLKSSGVWTDPGRREKCCLASQRAAGATEGPQGHHTHSPSSGRASRAAGSASFSANKPCSQTHPGPAPLLMAALPLDTHGWNCSRELLKTREAVFKPKIWLAPSLCDREQCISITTMWLLMQVKKIGRKEKSIDSVNIYSVQSFSSLKTGHYPKFPSTVNFTCSGIYTSCSASK